MFFSGSVVISIAQLYSAVFLTKFSSASLQKKFIINWVELETE